MTKTFEDRIYVYLIRLISFLNKFSKEFILREIIRQVVRSGTSVGANYFEAKNASSRRDYQNYFNHSLKSANETVFWINLLLRAKLVSERWRQEGRWLLNETREIASIFAASILTLKRKG